MIEIVDEEYKVDKAFYLDKLQDLVKELEIEGDIVIKLGGKEESQALNAQYRKKDYPTDVLSFPFEEEVPDDGFYLGDIFICFPVAVEQAEEGGITIEQELLTLMLHGILHLAGYDHETDSGDMQKLQEKLLEKYIQ
jgi:probable rRNA maturation factor